MEALFGSLGEPAYRGRQLYDALYRRRVPHIEQITSLSRGLRARLAADYTLMAVQIHDTFTSTDGTRRYLLRLVDGELVESVFIPEPSRDTICISSQVGCAVGCEFCMTARVAARRNMTAGEIVSQVLVVLNDVYGAGTGVPHGTNVVYMGMGEPFLNYRECMASARLLTDAAGLSIAPRRITVSTSGIVPRIRQFGGEPDRPALAVSLTATTDALRDRLIPLNRRHPLDELMAACREFPLRPRERLTFEYVLLDGINDSLDDARRLVGLLRGIRAKINLIAHNPAPELPFRASPERRVLAFQREVVAGGVRAFLRRPRGQDVSAACGQLAARVTASAS
jgi:23S rRNA (adenine2503-C2)-methyltransferase